MLKISQKKKKSATTKFYKRLFKLGVKSLVIAVVFISIYTLCLRVMPVPFSSYMIEKKIEAWQSDKNYRIRYDWVSIENIAWQMQLAVIASEDQRFTQHSGFDWQAIRSALQHNKKGKKLRGGSTISQQTAKNLYLWSDRSWLRKGLEIPTTLMLETLWSKRRILEVYLNIAEFGDGIFGVEAASRYYFHKAAKDLNQAEAALLAAVLPNPIHFKVNAPSSYVKDKQTWIMRQMRQLGSETLKVINE